MKKINIFSFILLFMSFSVFGQSKLKPHYKGYDIFSVGKYVYIVRSDIGAFLKAKTLAGKNNRKSKIELLNESMTNAKHYLGYKHKGKRKKVAIWGDSYTVYKDFGDPKGKTYTISAPQAQNGDHYFAKNKKRRFYVIKGDKYYVFKKLSDSKPKKFGTLPDYLQKGDVVAYWAKKKYIYILRNDPSRGPLIYKTKSLKNPTPSSTVTAPNEGVRNFLIGGLTAKKGGKTSVVWKSVSKAYPFCNNSTDLNSTVAAPKLSESITVGFVKGSTTSIEHNWLVSAKYSYGNDVSMHHVELSAEYGGAEVKTSSKEWSNSNTTTVTLDEGKQVKGGQCIGYWQGHMYINGQLMMTTGIQFTDNKYPPKKKPVFHRVK